MNLIKRKPDRFLGADRIGPLEASVQNLKEFWVWVKANKKWASIGLVATVLAGVLASSPGGKVLLAIIGGIVLVLVIRREELKKEPEDRFFYRPALSDLAARTQHGQLICPNCGGAQFTAKRSALAKTIGILLCIPLLVPGLIVLLLAPKTKVRCVTCGTEFRRG